MKKLVAGLLVLTAAAAVYAQDNSGVKISGSVNGGFNLKVREQGDDYTEDYQVFANSRHDDADNFRGMFKASYAEEFYGVSTGFKGYYSFDTFKVEPYDIVGWVKPFKSDLLTIHAGQTGSDWGSGGKLDTDTGDADWRFSFRPISGLNLGFTLGNRRFFDPTNKDYFDKFRDDPRRGIVDYLAESAVGVKYDVDMFSVGAAFRAKSDGVNGDRVYPSSSRTAANDGGDEASGDFKAYLFFNMKKIPGVDGLNFNAGARFTHLSAFADVGRILFALGVGYDIGNFGVGAGFKGLMYMHEYTIGEVYDRWDGDAKVFVPTVETKDGKAGFGWLFEIEPSYKIIPDKLKAILYFNIHNDWENAGLVDKNQFNIEVSPRLEYTILKIGNGELWSFYDFTFLYNGYRADAGLDPAWRMAHELSVRFNWNF